MWPQTPRSLRNRTDEGGGPEALCGTIFVLLALMLSACATTEQASFDPAVEEGRRVVIRACAGCHSTSTDAPSAYRAAPPFWSLALEQTPEGLRRSAAETSAHQFAMPSIVLTSKEAADVVAYLRAVASADPRTRRRLGAPPCIATARC